MILLGIRELCKNISLQLTAVSPGLCVEMKSQCHILGLIGANSVV